MSAINTAAIGSPAGAHNLLGGQGHRKYSPELDELSTRRQTRHTQDSQSIGTSQAPLGTADQMWGQGRDLGAVGQMAFPHLYGQQFQGPGFDIRQMSQYQLGQYGQLAANMPASFNGGMTALHNASSFPSQADVRNTNNRDRQDPGQDWNQAFQGLSLGP